MSNNNRNFSTESANLQEIEFIRLTPHDLRAMKESVLNLVSAALIQRPGASVTDPTLMKISEIVSQIAYYDPEFVLKLAVYVRLDLNVRTTANYLFALACNIDECKPYVRKYFCDGIRLPSDWIDVAATYRVLPNKKLKGKSIPSCLRKSMSDKFPQFDSYQLGKYNNEKTVKRKLKKQREEREKNPERMQNNAKPLITIKQMIRDLHINEPVFPVMSILGKKYPMNEREFRNSGLTGSFEPEKAGMRMKLPTPETWETLLSEKGNKASTWEELIEHKKLPFMAMLRNIRNLIYTGVHPKYHRWVQNKLSNQTTIANCRQFPFSFFSAYEVIPRNLEHFKELTSNDATTGMRRKNRKPIVIAHMPQTNTFDDYRAALDQAVKLSTVYNCQPISGSVSVLCNVSQDSQNEAPGAKNMGSKIRNIAEIGYLLGLMAKYVCEDCDFRVYSSPSELYPNTSHLPVELSEGTILDNMNLVAEVAEKLGSADAGFPFDYLVDLIRDKKRINCLMVLSHASIKTDMISNLLKKYRELVNPDLLFVSVDLSGSGRTTLGADEAHPNDIIITGFSDQILRFIAERGDETQLQYVEHIDIAKKIGIKDIQEISLISPWWKWLDTLGQAELSFPNITRSERMKQMRIFISSTFLDMHGERDYISGVVIPELKFRAKQRKIDIVEVDLRWGLTEEDSQHGNTLSICLDEVENCLPFFVGILGERYGWAPENYLVPNDPRFNWVRNYPTGRSITELEIHRALQRDNYEYSEGSFFYFRDNSFVNSLPEDVKANFKCEDVERAEKMENLKNKIRESGRPVLEDYPCNFGGVSDEKAVTTDLELFGERVFNDLWSALVENFPEEERPEEVNHILEERSFHQSFATELSAKFFGRVDELKQLAHFVSGQTDNLMILVGESGEGKSSLMSKFAMDAADKDPHTFYLTHFIGASPGSVDIRMTVSRLCHELVEAFQLDVAVPEDYKELCLLLPEVLEQASFQGKLVLLIDGIDQLDSTKNRSHSMEWLPKKIPCKIILSSTPGSACVSSLDVRSQPYRELNFKPMKAGDKKNIVRELLARYNKKLDERPMNLQMRVLMRKADSGSPLYLTVACEELRLHGVYELVTERIRKLSPKLPGLFAEVIIRLENDHTPELVKNALSLICYSRNGVLESEIQEILQVEDEKWLRLFRALTSYLIVSEGTGEIKFFHRYFTEAVAKRYYTTLHQQSIHTKLAQYFYNCLDVHHDFTWDSDSDMINDRAIRELPYHLTAGKQWKLLVSVLTDLDFIEMKMMLGFSYGLIDDYASATSSDIDEYDDKDLVRKFREFIKSNRHILHENPDLTFQQAANLPNHASPAQKAASDWNKGSCPDSWLMWLNKATKNDPCKMTLSGFSDGVTSSCYSPYGDTFALAFRDCSIKLFDSETGNELTTMLGHSNWITSIKYSPDGSLLASVSWDQSAIVWDVRSATIISVFKEHGRRINSCCFSHDGNVLATGAWDCTVKLWDVVSTTNNRSIRTVLCGERPINEISFSPDDSLIIAATWDGTVAFIDISDYDKTHVSKVPGHQKSIKTIEFSPSGKHFITGSMDKSVILWDANARKPITTLSKHSKPVTSVTYSRDGDYLSSASVDGTVKVWDANLGSEVNSFRYSDHSYTQQCASFHPTDTSILATGCGDCSILIWNWQNGTLIAKLEGHRRAPHYLEYSPCGSFIASASEDGMVIVWNSETYQQNWCFEEHRGPVGGLSWSPQIGERRLATCAQSIIIWDIDSGKISNRIEPEDKSPITAVSFDSKGKLIASASKDKILRIWDSRNGNQVQALKGHGDWVNSCHFQGNKVVSCSFDYSIRLWNAKNAKFTEMYGHTSAVNFVRFNPDGNTFVSCSSDDTLKIWDSYSCTEITTLIGHNGRVNSCCYSADGKIIASVSDDGFIKVWSPLESTEIETLIGHSGPVRNANFGSKNEIITSSDDRSARIWDLGITKEEEKYGSSFSKVEVEIEAEKQGLTGHSARINDSRINEDGTYLITASDDGSCRVWDLSTMKMVRVFTDPKERPYVGCDIYGTIIAMVTDTSFVTVWDITTGRKLHSENAFGGRPATCLRLTSHGKEVVVGGWTSLVKKMIIGSDAYNTRTFTQMHTDWITSIATNGTHFVSGGWDELIGVYSEGGYLEKSIAVHDSTITDCAISDNDLFIATTSSNGDIVLLSTRTFQKVGEMWNGCKANCISFGTDKKKTTLYTGGEDGYINVWDVNGKILNKFVCQAPITSIHARKIGQHNYIVAGDQIGNLYYIQHIIV